LPTVQSPNVNYCSCRGFKHTVVHINSFTFLDRTKQRIKPSIPFELSIIDVSAFSGIGVKVFSPTRKVCRSHASSPFPDTDATPRREAQLRMPTLRAACSVTTSCP
jgi:hypothetical protein